MGACGEISDLEARVLDLEARVERGWSLLKRLEAWLGSLAQTLGLAARNVGGNGAGPPAALLATTAAGPGGAYPAAATAAYTCLPLAGGASLTATNVGVAVPPQGATVLVSVLGPGSYCFQYDGGG